MKVREVTMEYGRTVNLGNYEFQRLTVGYTVTVDEGEDVAFAVAQLYEDCREQVDGRLDLPPAPMAAPRRPPEAD